MAEWDVLFRMVVRTAEAPVVERVAKIRTLASALSGLPLPPHVQTRLRHHNLARAVHGAAGLDGIELTDVDVAAILAQPADTSAHSRTEQEVYNTAALLEALRAYPLRGTAFLLTEDLLHDLHAITVRGLVPEGDIPGGYRTVAVRDGDYLPPEGERVGRLTAELLRWLAVGPPAAWDPVVRAVVAHFYLVSIRPFSHGNLRVSCAVEALLLAQDGVTVRGGVCSPASSHFRRRADYAAMLDHVRFHSYPDLTPFVVFGLDGLLEELEGRYAEAQAALKPAAFLDFARTVLVQTGRLDARGGDRLLRFLFGLERPLSLRALRAGKHPLAALYRDMSSKTLARDLAFLKEHGLVVVRGDVLEANLAAVMEGP